MPLGALARWETHRHRFTFDHCLVRSIAIVLRHANPLSLAHDTVASDERDHAFERWQLRLVVQLRIIIDVRRTIFRNIPSYHFFVIFIDQVSGLRHRVKCL